MNSRRGALLTILLVLAALLSLEARDQTHFATDDNVTHFLPWYVHNLRTLRQTGELAMVNWHQYQGQPHFAHGMSGTAYPPHYLAAWLAVDGLGDPEWAIDLLVIAHLVAGAVVLFYALVERGCAPALASAGAAAAATLPWFVGVSRIWVSAAVTFFFLAVSAWCLGRLEDGGSRRRLGAAIGWFALARGAFVLHGNVQFVVFAAFFEGIWIAFKLLARQPGAARVAMGWAAGNALGALVALPLLAEMLPAAAASRRAAPQLAEMASQLTVPPEALLGAQVGWFPPLALMDFGAEIAMAGALAAAGLGWVWSLRGPRPASPSPASLPSAAAWPWLAVAAVAALAAMNWLPLYSLPGLDRFRWPFKFLAFLGWFGTVGATLFLARLQRAGRLRMRVAVALVATAALAQLAVSHLPSSMKAFAPRRTTAEGEKLARVVPTGAGRLAAVGPGWIELTTPFTFNRATLSGHLAFSGYDQLISRAQRARALDSAYTGFIRGPLKPPLFATLERLGVRWVMAGGDPAVIQQLIDVPGLTPRLTTERTIVFETAAPWPLAWFAREETPEHREACAVEARGNRWIVRLPPGAAGRLWINVFPLPGLECRFDRAPAVAAPEVLVPPGGAEPMPTLRLPAGVQTAEWTVALPRLRWTVPVAVLAAGGCLLLAWRGQRKSPADAPTS